MSNTVASVIFANQTNTAVNAEINGTLHTMLPWYPEQVELTDNSPEHKPTGIFKWASTNPFTQIVLDATLNADPIVEPEPYVSPPLNANDVWLEKDLRLAEGFEFTFEDDRGTHRFRTGEIDMRGWMEVAIWADLKYKLGDLTATTSIMTENGVIDITPPEWYIIVEAMSNFRQRIWKASFQIVQNGDIPENYKDDSFWE